MLELKKKYPSLERHQLRNRASHTFPHDHHRVRYTRHRPNFRIFTASRSKTPPSEIITSFHPSTFHGWIHGLFVYLYTSFLPPSSSWRRDSWHIFIPVDGNTVLECRTGRRHHAVTRIRHRARCSSGSITGGGMDGRVTVKSNGN